MATPSVAVPPAPPASAAASKATPAPVSTGGSLPPSDNQATPSVQPPSGDSSAPAAVPGPTPSFGVIATGESNPQDANSGLYRDGRIRDPVPSKLKGKTDGSKGNFSVMHMEVAGRNEPTERDAEAKRTSESTELAAKLAFENGYVSLRRSRFIQISQGLHPSPGSFVPAQTPASAPGPTQTQFERTRPLSPEETKAEQARLLTLLRSLHPVLVVDQICKALAFFGGIPGAPPPANGGFPESAEANGSGSLFVGWIAEIFPKLGGNSGQQTSGPNRQLVPEVRRKRGRPKGSKSKTYRKDKGIKKGSMKPANVASNAASKADQRQPGNAQDDSWVDVDDNAMEVTDDVDANVMLLARATGSQPQEATSTTAAPGASARTALPGAPAASGTTTEGEPIRRKRGRPKGSKNKPKGLAARSAQLSGGAPQAGTQVSQALQGPSQGNQVSQISQSAQSAQSAQAQEGSAAPQSFTSVNSAAPGSAKRPVGRPKGSGSTQKQSQGQSSGISPELQQQSDPSSVQPANPSTVQVQAAPSQATQTVQGSQGQVLTLPTPPTASPARTKAVSNTGQKRKRKGVKEAEHSQPDVNNQHNPSSSSPQVNNLTLPTPPNNSRPFPPEPTGAAGPPPPKRQRKGKEPRLSGQQGDENTLSTATGGSANAPAAVTVSLDSVPNPSPRSAPAPPPAEARKPESTLVPSSVPVDPQVSIDSPQPSHFEVQSPTMENYEAQLQAQLEQQAEVEPQAMASQNRPDPAHLMATHAPQQQQQQQKYSQPHHHHPRQQQQQHHASTAHSQSPKQQQLNSQGTGSPSISQQQARNSQVHYSSNRASGSQYQHQQQQQPQRSQQNYVSPQTEHTQPQQQFSGGQQAAQSTQVPSTQQYSTSTRQSQAYTSKPQSYTPSQQQFSSGQQQLAQQQRYQAQLATTSAGSTSYAPPQSSQFGTSASNSYSAEGNYRTAGTSLSTTSYGQRNQPAATSVAASLRATSTHGLPHHTPSFGTSAGALQQQQQRSGSVNNQTTQSMQGLAGVQTFGGNAATSEWSLFDAGQLDTSSHQGAMGLANANYGVGAAGVRAASNPGSAFASSALGAFDTSGLSDSDRYYGVGRR
ncbi:hypothetical protein N656DRAFT_846974 [Canariomyces notabilis]|uniref:Uncharacterized protein n=1 Tax=Canariomyces notabilis TaxID=2074819 RepID=A0AAN6QLR9_9PEZI|nr:hypothetical protein N656DRAFT_846974 [Canariomyces arenarius]